jgi:arabinogalactan endo-1,4-beta-galactosidase
MADLFKEVIPSILQTKKVVVTEENENDYVPFIVNKALSFHRDCVLYANEMNKLPNTDRLLQYNYLINTVRGYKRPFQKWQKYTPTQDLELIKEYFNFSTEKAKDALSILSEEQLDEIRRRLYKGGLDDRFKRTGGGKAQRTR